VPKQEIEEFARLVIAHVRDMAISSCDSSLNANAVHAIAQRWRDKISHGDSADLVKTVVADCVDQTLFYLFHAIDEGLLRINFVASTGKVLDLTEDGESEMAGWYMGTEGWRAAYSKERFIDDFADIN
jgi:hypothetical protein